MTRIGRLLPALLLIGAGTLSSCRGTAPLPPVVLYGGEPRPAGDIAVIEVVRTGGGRPTIDVREVVEMVSPPVTLFSATEGKAWEPPAHFAGPPGRASGARRPGPGDIPHRFEVLPGSYLVEFLYVPLLDRFGFTHVPRGRASTVLDCEAGRVYRLQGKLDEDGGFYLTVTAVRPEAGGG